MKSKKTDLRSTRKGGFYADGYPSVTTILRNLDKPALNKWLCKQTFEAALNGAETFSESQKAVTKISRKAMDIGLAVHKYVEFYKTDQQPDLLPGFAKYYDAFHSWLIDYKPKIVANEVTVTSKEFVYKGTADLLAKIDGKNCLVDLKTGKGIYETVGIQASAYKQAFEEQEDEKIDEIWCLLLEKGFDGEPTGEYKFEKLDYRPEIFNALVKIFWWKNEK